MDKIIIKGLRVYAYHGVNPEEKEKGQPFIVDAVAHTELTKASMSDDLNDTVSYAQMSKVIRAVMLEAKYDLIEKVAGRIAEELLKQFGQIVEIEVTVKKPRAPMTGDFDYTAVAVTRRRC